MDMFDLFFELSHKSRYDILQLLSQGIQKHNFLEKQLQLPGAEISRHLKRLQNLKLIQKQTNNEYSLTSFGKMLCSSMSFFENGVKFVDFINSHDFTSIPLDTLFQIGNANDMELRASTMENITLWTELLSNAKKFVYCITDQILPILIPIIQTKFQMNANFDIKVIIGQKLISEFQPPEDPQYNSEKIMKMINFFNTARLFDPQNIALIVSDQGTLIFLKSRDTIDYSNGIYGKSDNFIKASIKIFDLIWDRAKPISRANLKEK